MVSMEDAALAGWWIAWCVLHSGLIASPVTAWLQRRFGSAFRCYRLVYNLIALATFIALVRYARVADSPVLFPWEGGWLGLRVALIGTAAALFLAGARLYSTRRFLGLEQLRTGSHPVSLAETGGLQTKGIHRVTRHPWYLAALLLIWTVDDVTAANLVGKMILSLYLFVGARLEERKLVAEYGDEYRRYRQQVSMLVPFKYAVSRLRGLRPRPGR